VCAPARVAPLRTNYLILLNAAFQLDHIEYRSVSTILLLHALRHEALDAKNGGLGVRLSRTGKQRLQQELLDK